MRRLLLPLAGLVLVTACSSPAPAVTRRVAPTTATPHAASTRSTLEGIVEDPRSTLYAADARPGPSGLTVSTWWTLRTGDRVRSAIVTSDDGFKTPVYKPGTPAVWARHRRAVVKHPGLSIPTFRGLVSTGVVSLAADTRAYVAGGDGATLLPFDAVARSEHAGPWTGFVVAMPRGARAYVSGEVVLPDGRLLVLLDDWSSDRRARPGPEYHGLWISAGDDWARYRPYRPRLIPAPGPDVVTGITAEPGPSRVAPHGIVAITTRAGELYVSVDGGRTFRRIRDR